MKCIAYDFDGTLGNTRTMAWNILNTLADQHGFNRLAIEDFDRARDMTKAEFIKFIGVSKLRLPALLNQGRRMMHSQIRDVCLFDHMAEVVRELAGHVRTQGIITSNIPENVEAVLERYALRELIFISSVPKLGKKHRHLRALMRTFTYLPTEIVYVGDETRDISAARKVGVMGVGVTWGFNSRKALQQAGASHIVDTPQELKELLLSL